MDAVGIDTSEQHPKGLKNSVVACAWAEKNCPKTFHGVGTRQVWTFDDPSARHV